MTIRFLRGFVSGLVVTGAIALAGASASLIGDPPVETQVLSGPEARAFAEAQNRPLAGGEDRGEFKRQYEALMRTRGWQPASAAHVYVRHQFRNLTLTRRFVEWLAPTLYAATYYGSGGYVYAESWDDGDGATWEGYSEVCANGYNCVAGVSQVHTGDGSVVYASGNPLHTDAFQGWAACSYAGCFGYTWGCWLAGPAYFQCLGVGCVSSAVGCGAYTVLTHCQQHPYTKECS